MLLHFCLFEDVKFEKKKMAVKLIVKRFTLNRKCAAVVKLLSS